MHRAGDLFLARAVAAGTDNRLAGDNFVFSIASSHNKQRINRRAGGEREYKRSSRQENFAAEKCNRRSRDIADDAIAPR